MNPYDAVRYPTYPKPQTHPDRMAALATLFGMEPASVTSCRVLELGCGTGGNLIPMAFGLPESRFTGVDLAAGPIEEGRQAIADLGLRNIELHAMDLAGIAPEFGAFDYVIAHGVYSWVPRAVRDKLLEVCRANLAPQGVAFVSYNVYPGCHLRQMVREMMLYRAREIADSGRQLYEARSLASMLAEAQGDTELRKEMSEIVEREAGALFHDDLAEINEPVYFHEFAAHAAAHGLAFLSEANYFAMQDAKLPQRARAALKALGEDVIRREQYLDFFKLRRFRHTLLCRAGTALVRPPRAERIARLLISSEVREASVSPQGVAEFRDDKGSEVKTAHPLARAALEILGSAWPRRLPFSQLLAEARERAPSGEPEAADAAALPEILMLAYEAGVVDFHAHAPRIAAEPGERPLASPVARMQLRVGNRAATLYHGVAEIDTETGCRLIQLLDGNRHRAQLAAELGATGEHVETALAGLARLPLLLA